ncbi:uncharacterized protein A4U43_C06F14640 [Asparagus officinalis]|uniref:Uncharacterized protein n=1 Tax=Asparagus officinalis TaxID=4686 RepID=A0A5P1EPF3_ASPOF|nr:uncharacterized protein A4U43_C06F14640 [Asparagus officinalis]
MERRRRGNDKEGMLVGRAQRGQADGGEGDNREGLSEELLEVSSSVASRGETRSGLCQSWMCRRWASRLTAWRWLQRGGWTTAEMRAPVELDVAVGVVVGDDGMEEQHGCGGIA